MRRSSPRHSLQHRSSLRHLHSHQPSLQHHSSHLLHPLSHQDHPRQLSNTLAHLILTLIHRNNTMFTNTANLSQEL